MLITIEEAELHLILDLERSEGSPSIIIDERLPDLLLKMAGASEIVLDYLKRAPTGWDDVNTPALVKSAVLLVLGGLWEQRGGETNDDAPSVDHLLTSTVRSLLHRYRDPALA